MSHPSFPPLISKLLPLLGSDKDGEVVATARAICRTLGSAGLDLHDLVKAVARPPVLASKTRRKQQAPSWQAPYGSINPDADIVAWCRRHGDEWLPLKDRDFLASVEPKLLRWGGRLTPSQQAWLFDIRDKVEAREAA